MSLTREQIENEPSGHALNLWVAEATGAEMVPGAQSPAEGTPESIARELALEAEGKPYFRVFPDYLILMPGGRSGEEWSPSTDIAAAWTLVEGIKGRYHAVIKSPFDAGHPYFAGFTQLGATGFNGRPDHYAEADSAQLAICRAFLLTRLAEDCP